MSIYPVRLSEWFPPNDEYYCSIAFVCDFARCYACGSKVKYRKAIGHHSLMVGVGEVWCSWKCCNSGKVARADKRRVRSERRRASKKENFLLLGDYV